DGRSQVAIRVREHRLECGLVSVSTTTEEPPKEAPAGGRAHVAGREHGRWGDSTSAFILLDGTEPRRGRRREPAKAAAVGQIEGPDIGLGHVGVVPLPARFDELEDIERGEERL